MFRSSPLFVKIFLVMVASTVTVQLLNFGLLEYVGLPFPRIYTVTQVANALRTGHDPDGEIEVTEVAECPIRIDGRAERTRNALAGAIGVSERRVRVSLAVPLQGDSNFTLLGIHRPPRPKTKDPNNAFLVGDFAAAAQARNGTWHVAHVKMGEGSVLRYNFAILLIVAVLTIAPVSWVMSRRVARPIGMFAAAAERLGRDPRAKPMRAEGSRELKEAAGAFNRMQARLNRYVEDRILLIAAIAHDLRTPLMRLSLRMEHAPEQLRTSSEADIADMEAMIASATAFVRDMTEAPNRRRLDLRSLIETITDELTDAGQDVSLADGDPIIIDGDAAGLKSLISNLLGNALKYAGNAQIRLMRKHDTVAVEVRDTGPGIPDKDLDHVFEPFYRGEASRNRDTGGSGLGLASVRAVAHAHGGFAEISNHPDGGALARVVLPA